MSKDNKKIDGEDYILKKIRYYQGSIDDYDTFWKKKIAEGESEVSAETKGFKKRNAELNKAFEIIPVEKDNTVVAKDVISGKDADEPKENKDEKPTKKEEGDKEVKKDSDLEAEKEDKKKKKED